MRIPFVRGSVIEHIDLVPSKMVGIGINDRAHAAEMKHALPEEPLEGFDTFCPIGPRIVAGLDPSNLAIKTRLNGVVNQDSTTADLIFDVPALIAFVSEHMTLEPGDVLSTGTPSGVGNLAPGDDVAIEIEGIGALRNPVIARP